MIAVQDIIYARYQVHDLEAASQFMQDYGLLPSASNEGAVYLRGYGEDHHIYVAEKGTDARCIGFALAAKSAEDLETLSRETGAPVELINEPGGGRRVVLVDPTGFRVEVVHGTATLAAEPVRRVPSANFSDKRQRINEVIHHGRSPAHVMRLGHIALIVSNLDESIAFYTKHFGMKVADTYYVGEETNRIAAFLRCGLGDDLTDHHTVAMVQASAAPPRPTFDHASFEVLDWDDVMLGHDHMRRTGRYTHSWGVGRHVDGSNIFDYWRDPFGFKIEHYADGDIVNDHYAAAHSRFDPSDPSRQLSVWGPDVTPAFFS